MTEMFGHGSANEARNSQIGRFVGPNANYYAGQFESIGAKSGFTLTFNLAAAFFGSMFFAARGLWNLALAFIIVETLALVQIVRGAFGDLTSDMESRAATIATQLEIRRAQLDKAISDGAENLDSFKTNIASLEDILTNVQNDVIAAQTSRVWIILFGILLLLLVKVAQGAYANTALEKRFSDWLSEGASDAKINTTRVFFSAVFCVIVYSATAVQFALPGQIAILNQFPTLPIFRSDAIKAIEVFFDWLTLNGDVVFNAVSRSIRLVLDILETIFVGTPWLVIIAFVVALTALSAGPRAAIFSGAFLFYMGVVGLWEMSLQTLALLGTAACISIGFGIPLGVFCARRPRVFAIIRPILDSQQTMPAFVYMIPIITIFGTGKPSAVVTCMIFGMPPCVRLTVLGLQAVPASIREAAIAYGASNWYLLTKVDLPLAAKSIRTGMNQTILLSLLTVVVASLIGAKGLGEDVLEALQYASVGQGILAGLAILFIALILDGIVQGKNKNG